MSVTYDILLKVPSQAIQEHHQIEKHTACDWFQFFREVLADFVRSESEMMGGGGVKLLKLTKVNLEEENTTGVATGKASGCLAALRGVVAEHSLSP
jgi:hypothetical protein